MRKLKTFIAVLMLLFVLGLAAPQALAGEIEIPPGDTLTPPGQIETPPGFADWANIIIQICGNSWSI